MVGPSTFSIACYRLYRDAECSLQTPHVCRPIPRLASAGPERHSSRNISESNDLVNPVAKPQLHV